MFDETFLIVGLVAANVALYSTAAYQLLRRRSPLAAELGGAAAFDELRRALQRADPSTPRGFTWREALGRARMLGVEIDWAGVESEVAAYEAFRYGSGPPLGGYDRIATLAKELRKFN